MNSLLYLHSLTTKKVYKMITKKELYLKDCGDQYKLIKETSFDHQVLKTNIIQNYVDNMTNTFNHYINVKCDVDNPEDIMYNIVCEDKIFGTKLISIASYITEKYFSLIRKDKNDLAEKFLNFIKALIENSLNTYRKYPEYRLGQAIFNESCSLIKHDLKGKPCDCFYDDTKIKDFLSELFYFLI